MTWFDNWPIRKKLLSAFAVLAVLTASVGAIGVRNMGTLAGLTSNMYELEATGLSVVKEANVGLVRAGRSLRGALLADTDDVRSSLLGALEADLVNTARLLDSADVLFIKPEGKKIVAESKARFAEYSTLARGVVERANAEPMPGARTAVTYMRDSVNPKAAVLDSVLTVLAQFKEANAAEASASATAIYQTSRTAMLVFVVVAVVIGVVLGFLLANRLSGAIAAIVEAARALRTETVAPLGQLGSAIASGDVQRTIEVKGQTLGFTRQDEIGDMARAFDQIVEEAKVTAASLDEGRQTIARMVTETQGLIAQASEGNLGDRANAGSYRGSYAALVGGVNQLLDSVVTPMRDVNAVLDRVAARDLSARVSAHYEGEFAAMADALNLAANNLDQAMSQVSMASSQVAAAGEQIASGSQALASGASEQAASLEEISSSLTELSSMAGNSSKLASQADLLSKSARDATSDGQVEMQKLASTMTDIRDAAHETSRIIKTIDEIAFQTNLLALNAAVEAARAGDAGRGFAVVADEVRALAIRAADAARSTTELIERSVTLAQSGVAANAIVSEKLYAIDGSVTDVSHAMVEIANGAKQQADGVAQINKAVEQLNATTQQVAANAEESASASEELAGQATQLQALVGQFDISGERDTRKLPARAATAVRASRSATREVRHVAAVGSNAHRTHTSTALLDDDEGMHLF